jgi:hypothetical protein
MAHAEEDVAQLSFGDNFRDVEFIANAGVFALLTAVRQRRLDDEAAGRAPDQPRPSEAFERARDFAGRFGGAMQALDVEKQDRVLTLLSELRFNVPKKAGGGAGAGAGAGGFMDDDGLGGGGGFGGAESEELEERSLHMYEVTALLNLNPASVAAAKALVPSLENIRDEDFEAAITIVRNATLNIDAAPAPAPADGEEM